MEPILVVDDEQVMRESLSDWLSDVGYPVTTARDGEEALKTLAEKDFAIAILDVRLPGKNGIEVLKEARARNPGLRGIVITAYPSVQTAVEALRHGAVDYLPKPFDLNELEQVIRRALGPVQVEIKPGAPVEAPALPEVAPEVRRARIEEVIDRATGKVCQPPCQIACPVGEDIQRTNVMISLLRPDSPAEEIIKIADEIWEKNPLFTICGYVCGLCERECNYKEKTGAVRRRLLKRFLSDHFMPYLATKPALPLPLGQKIAVVGGGPGGLMCAYSLSRKGYRVTIFERSHQLGGALRYIPHYRLPRKLVDDTLDNLVRIANIDVRCGTKMGGRDATIDGLRKAGFRSVFIATGTHMPRALTFGRQVVPGADLEGVEFGLRLLDDTNHGKVSSRFYRRLYAGKRAVVIGGGNVAFDMARTARRLGADVTMVCLENADKKSKDGIPADVEEIQGALEEGITINYSRGTAEIIGENGKFKRIKCPRCVSVFDANGFNPKFDNSDVIYIDGDLLLVTIGQGIEAAFLGNEGLLDERGRLEVDPVTLMSNRRAGVFIGGDVRKLGFAAEAMREGMRAAESIDRYLHDKDLKAGRERETQKTAIPSVPEYKPPPEPEWLPADERLNFELFEKGFTLEEAVREAKRCLYCGPCKSCKACVALGLQPEIGAIRVDEDKCSACGVCPALCSYEAIKLVPRNDKRVAVIDDTRCKRCGTCAAACPGAAITIERCAAQDILTGIEEVLA